MILFRQLRFSSLISEGRSMKMRLGTTLFLSMSFLMVCDNFFVPEINCL